MADQRYGGMADGHSHSIEQAENHQLCRAIHGCMTAMDLTLTDFEDDMPKEAIRDFQVMIQRTNRLASELWARTAPLEQKPTNKPHRNRDNGEE